jgi:hypothetical protein
MYIFIHYFISLVSKQVKLIATPLPLLTTETVASIPVAVQSNASITNINELITTEKEETIISLNISDPVEPFFSSSFGEFNTEQKIELVLKNKETFPSNPVEALIITNSLNNTKHNNIAKNETEDLYDRLNKAVICERRSAKKTKDYKAKLWAVLDFSVYGKLFRDLATLCNIELDFSLIDPKINLSKEKPRQAFIDAFIVQYIKINYID